MAALDALLFDRADQRLDVVGSIDLPASFLTDYTDETKYERLLEDEVGELIGSTATDGEFTTTTNFQSTSVDFTTVGIKAGDVLWVRDATTTANETAYKIEAVVDANNITVSPAANTAEAGITFSLHEPYSLEHDINYERHDRHQIKGTTSYKDPVPTYTDPTNTGTPKDANLTNIAGNTLDAHLDSLCREADIKLRTTINGSDGSVTASSDTFTTTDFHFISDDVDSFVSVVDGTATGATGVYRISAVTDGQTLTLNGLNPTGTGTVTWTLLSDVKSFASARQHADSIDNRGIPLADSGALDETNYDATFVGLLNADQFAAVTDLNGDRIYGRIYGDELHPSETAATDGVRFAIQLLTGVNNGTATDADWGPILSGRSGSAATIAGGDKVISGLTNVSEQDRGRFISVWGVGTDGFQGYYEIDTVDTVNDTVTVVRGSVFSGADPNNGAIEWAITDQEYTHDITGQYADIVLMNEMGKADRRKKFTSGVIGDAEINRKIHDIFEFLGSSDGEESPVLTNTGNYFIFSQNATGDVGIVDPNDTDVEELLNAINREIGDRDFDAVAIDNPLNGCSGEDITSILLKLGNAIAATSIVRTIERLTGGEVAEDTAHTLPGGITYTLDGTDNGRNLWVAWRKLMRVPGPNTFSGNDYEETSTTSITPYEKIKQNDVIQYWILQ